MIVSRHACERFIERVDNSSTLEEAEAVIRTAERAVNTAASFGCKVVRMGCGAKLVLCGTRVVTVLGRKQMCTDAMSPRVPA
jgi:Tfp pilus assembly protein PilX